MLAASPAQAIEPLSIAASVVGGSIFCKMISCKTVVNKTELIDLYKTRQYQLERFNDIRKNGLKLTLMKRYVELFLIPMEVFVMKMENGVL